MQIITGTMDDWKPACAPLTEAWVTYYDSAWDWWQDDIAPPTKQTKEH